MSAGSTTLLSTMEIDRRGARADERRTDETAEQRMRRARRKAQQHVSMFQVIAR